MVVSGASGDAGIGSLKAAGPPAVKSSVSGNLLCVDTPLDLPIRASWGALTSNGIHNLLSGLRC
ncbi:hypothetical protein [Streptomyces sp. NBC_01334]|uniref:hypothetical protein n=1 Tax=Streptomyces sp. NBC_01334 TaxID=2903827 RepID=UPI002E0ED5BA|nr:hypothetical protein OG736_01255 [Streptomyces sp. NBC_01334]